MESTIRLMFRDAEADDYLKFIGTLFKLTPKEYDVFNTISIYYLSGNNPFSIQGKRAVAKQIGFDDYTPVNYYMKQFRDKGVLFKDDDGSHIFNSAIFKERELPTKIEIGFEYRGQKEDSQKSLASIQPQLQ